MRPLAFLLALTLAAPVHAFTAQNGLVVEPDGDGFVVSWRGLAGPDSFWCAAGDYAIRALRLNPTQIVYRASPPKRKAGEPVRFTLDPSQSAAKTGLFVLGARGGGITAGHAQGLCENRRPRNSSDRGAD
ncbi:hypothetical protein OEW28_11475 [Defluviimonas sp. WL0002]|uniref:Uncharacterized protein n=1 Tax=Albidovulum marisflavi TaxID=2984159 RepID=A0ABT2ZDM6_9RHOB|nr:hypothetical protein [Defluviimonas sp. WL0002]MCV2869248.1 hypothetical protein [Defluviimonas sp. WL0002]